MAAQISKNGGTHIANSILPRYLSAAQAAKYCGYSVSYFEKLRKGGRGPAYTQRSRKDIRYLIDDLDAWMSLDKVQTLDSVSQA